MSDLTWEISYLEKNEKPTDSFGCELDIISGVQSNLKDQDVQKLSAALEKNSVFQGGINLQENLLTDLSVLYLTRSLKVSKCQISYLNLSYNNLRERSGVYIGDLLGEGYKLRELSLQGCCVDGLGVQRIFENLTGESKLRALDIGIVHTSGLLAIAKHLPLISKLRRLAVQQGEVWADDAMKEMVKAMRQNYSLLAIDVSNCENNAFVEEIQGFADRNTSMYNQKIAEKQQSHSLGPQVFAEEIQNFLENSIQNLPVRVYLQNALGTLLNDGIFQLMKYRFKENNPAKNTAVENIKWLVRFILDRSRN